MLTQLDLFGQPAEPAPAVAPEAAHWLVVTSWRAGTACGITIKECFLADRRARSAEGETIRCTHDRYDGTVTCPRCLEVA